MEKITIWDYTYEFTISELWISPTMCIYKTYKTNRPKYVQWYRYKDMEQLLTAKEKFLQAKKDSLVRMESYKEQRKIDAKAKKSILIDTYKVWDLFSYSRGYDQTNVEYYQITEKKWSKVYIKRIAWKTTDTLSWASENSKPVKDAFITDEYWIKDNGWKIIWEYWIRMAFWTLTLTTENEEHFSSSRA